MWWAWVLAAVSLGCAVYAHRRFMALTRAKHRSFCEAMGIPEYGDISLWHGFRLLNHAWISALFGAGFGVALLLKLVNPPPAATDDVLTLMATGSGIGGAWLFVLGVWFRWSWDEGYDRRAKRLKAERPGYTRDDFIRHFTDQGVPESLVAKVYETLQFSGYHHTPHFPVMPGDNLYDVYTIEFDCSDVIEDLMKHFCGRTVPHSEWDEWPEMTVESMVHFMTRYYGPNTSPTPSPA
jgi:hypothetical protein